MVQVVLAQRRAAITAVAGRCRGPGAPAGCATPSTPAAVHAHGRAARGRRDARRRARRARIRCTGCCRARSARARPSWRCGRCCASSTPAGRPRCWPPPRCSPQQHLAHPGRAARAAGPGRACSAARTDATRGGAAHRLACRRPRAGGPARRRQRARRHRRRHPRPARGPRAVRRPRPGRRRRAAPVRRRAARRAARPRPASRPAARAGHDRHPDPAHRRDDRVRRPGGLDPARAARAGAARSRPTSCRPWSGPTTWTGLGAGRRGGGGRAPGVRRVPADRRREPGDGSRRAGLRRCRPGRPARADRGATSVSRGLPGAARARGGPLAGLRLAALHGRLAPTRRTT